MSHDAIVIGSGPNGLCAAIVLAQSGRKVLLREGADTIGGSCRSAELTLPGFVHDVCASVHALGVLSPFIRQLPLREHGLEWVYPPIPFAHPLDHEAAALADASIDQTAEGLGRDGPRWREEIGPLARNFGALAEDLLAPLRWPRHPMRLFRFGLGALRSAHGAAHAWFSTPRARALFAGAAAHATLPLQWPATAAMGLVLAASAHAGGWPIARGGSQKLTGALASYFRSLGGDIQTGAPVTNIEEFGSIRPILCDLTPRQFIQIAGHRLPATYRARLSRFRHGPGSFKVDYALDGPIPWSSPECARAGTLHLGGTLDEIAVAERAVWYDDIADRPYVLLVQPSLFDPTRAPPGKQTAWAYCHVPHGSTFDMLTRLENQIERFAPGFRDQILSRHLMTPADLERHNPNLVGGDISAGAMTVPQLFARPLVQKSPYATALPGVYLCSASTPPGPGVHGMCGYHAATRALAAANH